MIMTFVGKELLYCAYNNDACKLYTYPIGIYYIGRLTSSSYKNIIVIVVTIIIYVYIIITSRSPLLIT